MPRKAHIPLTITVTGPDGRTSRGQRSSKRSRCAADRYCRRRSSLTAGRPYSQALVATFADADPQGMATDYSATLSSGATAHVQRDDRGPGEQRLFHRDRLEHLHHSRLLPVDGHHRRRGRSTTTTPSEHGRGRRRADAFERLSQSGQHQRSEPIPEYHERESARVPGNRTRPMPLCNSLHNMAIPTRRTRSPSARRSPVPTVPGHSSHHLARRLYTISASMTSQGARRRHRS